MESNTPSIIITGASGFIGRHLVDDLKNDYRIFAIARRSQLESNISSHQNIAWLRTDIYDYENTKKIFREISTAGGADFLIHLAAYYDFSGENNIQYTKTNIEGTKNILELAQNLKLKLFIFISSVAACSFLKRGSVINENSPPDGENYYALSKREGERMVREISTMLPICIVRFGAVYSDWCEYPPLYVFLNTWLGKSLKRMILAGKGESAVPYIHIRDIITFFRRILGNYKIIKPAQIFIASTSGSTNHKTLFQLANRYYYGEPKKSINMPKLICGIGLNMMDFWGHIIKKPPFERPWMYRYIDLQLTVDNKQTCSALDWRPNERHYIKNRLPYLVERLKSEPYIWQARNEAALERHAVRPGLQVYTFLATYEETIIAEAMKRVFTAAEIKQYLQILKTDKSEFFWFIKLIYRLLLSSIHNSNKLVLHDYFELLAFNRFEAGFTAEEINIILIYLKETIINRLSANEQIKPFPEGMHLSKQVIYDIISMPIEFAIDEIEYQYQDYLKGDLVASAKSFTSNKLKTARTQLEETIWNCLVNRK